MATHVQHGTFRHVVFPNEYFSDDQSGVRPCRDGPCRTRVAASICLHSEHWYGKSVCLAVASCEQIANYHLTVWSLAFRLAQVITMDEFICKSMLRSRVEHVAECLRAAEHPVTARPRRRPKLKSAVRFRELTLVTLTLIVSSVDEEAVPCSVCACCVEATT